MCCKLALGTVQFGVDYGINNSRGKVPIDEVKEILSYAEANGVCMLDTAAGYGESEAIIGDYLSQSTNGMSVITKSSGAHVDEIKNDLSGSLKKMKTDCIYGFLLSDFSIQEDPSGYEFLLSQKESGVVQKVGFSVYYPHEVEYLLGNNISLDLIQIPFSILERRFEPYLSELRGKGVEIYARSIFLQGLYFRPLSDLTGVFRPIRSHVKHIQDMAENQKYSISTLCLQFVRDVAQVDYLVVGVDSLLQLKDNLTSLLVSFDNEKLYAEMTSWDLPGEEILIPSKWAV